MPCYYTGTREGDLELNLEEKSEALTKVTRLLCEVCQKFEGKLPKNAQVWWSEHKEIDRERQERETRDKMRDTLIKSAKSKLTQAEREAMGL